MTRVNEEARRKEKKKLKEEKVSDASCICTCIPLPQSLIFHRLASLLSK